MPPLPPQPLVQAFVVCREVFESRHTGDLFLVSPFSRVTVRRFPTETALSVYAHLTDTRGRYEVSLQLVDGDGEVVWTWDRGCVVEEPDPLMPHRILLREVPVAIPRAGRYDLVMVANGEPLAHHALWARQLPEDDLLRVTAEIQQEVIHFTDLSGGHLVFVPRGPADGVVCALQTLSRDPPAQRSAPGIVRLQRLKDTQPDLLLEIFGLHVAVREDPLGHLTHEGRGPGDYGLLRPIHRIGADA